MERARRRPPPVGFQPRFTLGLLYVVGFFFLFCLAFIGPALFEVFSTVPPGPEQERMAKEVAKETVQPRLWVALLLAAFTVGVGSALGLLPGLKRR